MDLPDFLTRTKHGEIRLAGHRIGLLHIVREFREGGTPETIVAEYPSLPLALVYKVIGFYLDNQPTVDEYVASAEASLEQQSAVNPQLDLAGLRTRMEAVRKAQHAPGELTGGLAVSAG